MNRFKKISLASLITLMAIATVANMAGPAIATSQGNAGQEKMYIPNVQFIAGTKDVNDTIRLTIINIGYNSATITSCILKDGSGIVITTFGTGSPQPVIAKGTFKVITLNLKPDTLVDGQKYTLIVVTANGGQFVSASFDTSSNAEYDPSKYDYLQSLPQATPISYWSSFLNPVVIGSFIAAVFSVIGAHKLSNYIIGSQNKKDRYVLFFFISVILISIIVWVSVYFFTSGTLSTM